MTKMFDHLYRSSEREQYQADDEGMLQHSDKSQALQQLHVA